MFYQKKKNFNLGFINFNRTRTWAFYDIIFGSDQTGLEKKSYYRNEMKKYRKCFGFNNN